MIRLECLNGDCGITEILEPQLIKIVLSNINVEIASPVVFHSFVHDAVSGLEFFDPIRPAAKCGSSVVAEISRLLPAALIASHQCLGTRLIWPTISGNSRFPG